MYVGFFGFDYRMLPAVARSLDDETDMIDLAGMTPAEVIGAARGRASVMVYYNGLVAASSLTLAVAPKVAILVGPGVGSEVMASSSGALKGWDEACRNVGLELAYHVPDMDPSDYGAVIMGRHPVTVWSSIDVDRPAPKVGPLAAGESTLPYWSEDRFIGLGRVLTGNLEALADDYMNQAMWGEKPLPFRAGSSGVVPPAPPFSASMPGENVSGVLLQGARPTRWRLLGRGDVLTLKGYPEMSFLHSTAPATSGIDRMPSWRTVASLPSSELVVALVRSAVRAVRHSEIEPQPSSSSSPV